MIPCNRLIRKLVPHQKEPYTFNQIWNSKYGKNGSVAFHTYYKDMYLRDSNYKKIKFSKLYTLDSNPAPRSCWQFTVRKRRSCIPKCSWCAQQQRPLSIYSAGYHAKIMHHTMIITPITNSEKQMSLSFLMMKNGLSIATSKALILQIKLQRTF